MYIIFKREVKITADSKRENFHCVIFNTGLANSFKHIQDTLNWKLGHSQLKQTIEN